MSLPGVVALRGMTKTYRGTCHCKAIEFECDLDLERGSSRCNCSFCTKARFWMTVAKPDAVRILRGDSLTDYQKAPSTKSEPFLHFYFCKTCGVRPFTKGGYLPAMGSEFYAINIAALDLTPEELAAIPVGYVNGREDQFNATPPITSYL
jgi:hypothetical protein